MIDLKAGSPHATYVAHCRAGELAYQIDLDTGRAIFPPRVLAPGTGHDRLEWRVSRGRGAVYATTAVQVRGTDSTNVALIDLDEGFRMMSRVEDVPAEAVVIGLRVRLRLHQPEGDDPPYPVFIPE